VTVLSETFAAHAREVMARYPKQRSALLMVLHDAQDEVGHVTDDVIREVADLFGLTSADVAGVVTFYTMYKRKDPGKFLISLCTQSACAFFGGEETVDKLREIVGPENETTADGLMSWEQVECLAFCNAAPACQVNYRDLSHLTSERAERLVAGLRESGDLPGILDEMRADAKFPEVSGA
jgi:NADH-quinone oxidoreductase subunit E